MTNFERQYQQVPYVTDPSIWYGQEYHRQCDEFDAEVCTGKSPTTGEPIPADAVQARLVSRNSREVREQLLRQMRLDARFGNEELAELRRILHDAISVCARLTKAVKRDP